MLALIYCGGGSSHFSNIEPLVQPELTPTPPQNRKKIKYILRVSFSKRRIKNKVVFLRGYFSKKKKSKQLV